jgi:type II restriction enzyme
MPWREDVLTIVQREWKPGGFFTLDDMYRFEPELAKKYPLNRHVRDKIRQQLQVLRDEGQLTFEDDHGTYRRTK